MKSPSEGPELHDVRLQLIRTYRLYRHLKGLNPDRFSDRLDIDQIDVALWKQDAKIHPLNGSTDVSKAGFWPLTP
jgi:hypothetical protein